MIKKIRDLSLGCKLAICPCKKQPFSCDEKDTNTTFEVSSAQFTAQFDYLLFGLFTLIV